MSKTYLLHGFTQSAASWRPLIGGISGAHALDLPGHGSAASAPTDFDRGGASLVARAGRGNWIGYSMGGRYALHIALARPTVVDRLVLVGAHPGLESVAARRTRHVRDLALAERIETIGVPAFLDEWLGQPLFEGLSARARGLPARTVNTAAGLSAALRGASVGRQRPLWDRLPTLDMPLLYVVGEHDAKYRAVGERVIDAVDDRGALAVVPDAGHAAPFENPGGFLDALGSWHPPLVSP